MSNISINCGLSASKNGASVSGSKSLSVAIAGDQMIANVQIIGFSAAEAIQLGDVATPGHTMLVNQDSTNYVEIAWEEAMTNKFKILAGGVALIPGHPVALWAQANTAAVNLLVVSCEL